MPGNGIFSRRQRHMNQEFFLKAGTRREMLRAASLLAGGSALAGLLPRTLLAEAQAAAAAKAQNPSAAPADPVEQMKKQMAGVPLQTLKLRDNIQMLSGPGGNMVFLDGPDGKILVDSGFASVRPKVKRALDEISDTPFKMLINTHWHFDHTDGNVAMHQFGATILAHENTRKRLSTPQVTEFVHYQSSNVLHMGDTWFGGMYPFFDSSTGGKIDGMIAAATRGISLADASTKIVPGHGPAGD